MTGLKDELRLDLVTGGNSGRASQAAAGRGGEGALRMQGASSAPRRSSSLTYALGRSLLGRRIDELKGWQALGVGRRLEEAMERLDDRLAIEIGLLDGVEPRLLWEKDISF